MCVERAEDGDGWQVADIVNNVKNNVPECLLPLSSFKEKQVESDARKASFMITMRRGRVG